MFKESSPLEAWITRPEKKPEKPHTEEKEKEKQLQAAKKKLESPKALGEILKSRPAELLMGKKPEEVYKEAAKKAGKAKEFEKLQKIKEKIKAIKTSRKEKEHEARVAKREKELKEFRKRIGYKERK